MSRRGRSIGFILAAAVVAVLVATCDGGDEIVDPPDPPTPVPASITVTPETVLLEALGDTVRLVARVLDQNGAIVSGAVVSWSSGDVSVATVSGAGMVTAVGNGTAVVTARVGGVTGQAQVAVGQRIASVVVGPDSVNFDALGDTASLVAEARDSNGAVVVGAVVSWSSGDESVATVSSNGLVTAVGNGAAVVTATAGAVEGQAQVAVGQRIASVVVTPDSLMFEALGDTARLVAEARDAKGEVVSGAVVSWSSGDESVATVSVAGMVTSIGNGAAVVTASAGGFTDQAGVVVGQQIASVVVTPDPLRLVALGDTARLYAEVRDPNGAVVSGAAVSWSSENESVATVSSGGLVTAVGNGAAVVAASTGGVAGQARVVVGQRVASVVVTPDPLRFGALGDTARLVARVLDPNGVVVAGAVVSWTSQNQSVATVSAAGLVTSVGNGAAVVTASTEGVTGQAQVAVRQRVALVVVAPDPLRLDALGDTASLVAEARDSNGVVVAGALVLWESNDESVVTVSRTGLVTAVGNGATVVKAYSGGIVGQAQVVVGHRVASVVVTPDSLRFDALGDTARLVARVLDDNGAVVSDAVVSWSSGNESVVTVRGSGLVTAAGNGAAVVTASAGGVEGQAHVAVRQRIVAVAVEPDPLMLFALGDTASLAAEARDSNGAAVAGAAVSWASGDDAVATVSDVGLVTAVGNGAAVVTASVAGVAGEAQVTVEQRVASVAVTPDSISLDAVGDTASLDAEARDSNGAVIAGAAVSWSSEDDSVATVSDAGLVTAAGNGATAVTASAGGVTGQARVVVGRWVASVVVTPDSLRFTAVGDTARLVAEARDSNGAVVAGAAVSWSSENDSVATVSDAGLVTAVGAGTTAVTASVSSRKGSASVTVGSSDREALVALYNATNGSSWTNNTNWLSDVPLNEWYGVRTDAAGRVLWLHLSGNSLTGSIPSELGDLSSLEFLNLSGNSLTGLIPSELGDLSNLQGLSLRSNGLTGSIPSELGDLSSLESLNLFGNSLTGLIPSELGDLSSLEFLNLSGNSLTGLIPSELGDLSNLQGLWLRSNGLTGSIPSELGDLSSLRSLDLNDNSLTGLIPSELGDLSNLQGLSLHSNGLTGSMPSELGDLSSLESLYLDGNSLTGLIPSELGHLSNLWALHLSGNSLTGSIPSELGDLSSLRSLDLNDNSLTGLIPSELGHLSNLWALHLSGNSLTGSIPPELGDLANLESLDLHSNGLTGSIPPELGDLANLESLILHSNGLTGSIPPELGDLANLESLILPVNGLTGSIPPELSRLSKLASLILNVNALAGPLPNEMTSLASLFALIVDRTVCAPRTPAFESWLNGLSHNLAYCIASVAVIPDSLSFSAAGDTARLVAEARDLSGAAVSGAVVSWSSGNDLVATVSSSGLVTAAGNGTTAVTASVENHQGSASVVVNSAQDPDRAALEALYNSTNGSSWVNNTNWLTDAPLHTWYGVQVDSDGRVSTLGLTSNGLTGPIPSELGGLSGARWLHLSNNSLTGTIPGELSNLSALEWLHLFENSLTGAIPSELGKLPSLKYLALSDNGLTGPIPSELGDLTSLETLSLARNDLSDSIPSELGNLSNLGWLGLQNNGLTGSIPPELGDLSSLRHLYLFDNSLTGSIPSELGDLSSLEMVHLYGNSLVDTIPDEMTSLVSLDSFFADQTVCAPRTSAFEGWLNGIGSHNIVYCYVGPPVDESMAYVTQAVPGTNYAVPILEGEPALLRVFVTAENPHRVGIPPVRATFYSGGTVVHAVETPAQPTNPIPHLVEEDNLYKSVNVEIPGSVLTSGLEMVVEIDPDSTLGTTVDVVRRIPENGRTSLDVRSVGVFDLTVIPFLLTSNPDSTLLTLTDSLGPDHELFGLTRTLLPIGEMEVRVHDPVWTSSSNTSDLVDLVRATRLAEGGTGYWMGMHRGTEDWPVVGRAYVGGRDSFSIPNADVIAHEFGHNLSLLHAPCGGAEGPDPAYPYADGRIGIWGWNSSTTSLVGPSTPDLMSYCGPPDWISDYHFSKAFNHRASQSAPKSSPVLSANQPTLLLWGGADADGSVYLNPAFVINAPPSPPPAGGEYRLAGESEDGRVLFSVDFGMQEIADGDGGLGFALTLPVAPFWAGALARITLTHRGSSAVLDREGDGAGILLRDPTTGQVRGLLLDVPTDPDAQADWLTPLRTENLDVQISRGIPAAGAWQR